MYRWIRPILFKLDAETAHRLALGSAKVIQVLPGFTASTTSASLEQEIWGLRFQNPVGIAAGLDKNAECIPYWTRIGCGFSEIGSVSADAAPGNPRPRAFRLPLDRALVNRMGLNNDGAEVVVRRIPPPRRRVTPIGVNIVKTNRDGLTGAAAIDDFCESYRIITPHADYVTLNVSCPNTEDGRTFEDPASLDQLLSAIIATGAKKQPLLVKFSPPDPEGLDTRKYSELISVALAHEVDGFVATNTAPDRAGLTTAQETLDRIGQGGLSGEPLADRSTRLIRFIYSETEGRVPIIGVGGINSGDEALRKIRAGASLLQIYTGLVYEGPRLIGRVVRALARYLEREQKHLTEIVGADA